MFLNYYRMAINLKIISLLLLGCAEQRVNILGVLFYVAK